MKLFSYIRVSHEDQKSRETNVNQENAINRYISAHPDIQIVHKFQDLAMSGAKKDRPDFLAMMDRLDEVDGIITFDISRLTRDLQVWNFIMFQLRDKKKILIKEWCDKVDNRA